MGRRAFCHPAPSAQGLAELGPFARSEPARAGAEPRPSSNLCASGRGAAGAGSRRCSTSRSPPAAAAPRTSPAPSIPRAASCSSCASASTSSACASSPSTCRHRASRRRRASIRARSRATIPTASVPCSPKIAAARSARWRSRSSTSSARAATSAVSFRPAAPAARRWRRTAMRALPVGVPKVMVSTMASGDTRPYVGPSDICMMYSVTDVQGINRISEKVLANAAHALAGMIAHPATSGADDQAGARPDDVRRHDAVRAGGDEAARRRLRLPRVPRHRRRRSVDGEARRFRPARRRDRRHHHRDRRRDRRRRAVGRPDAARRVRAPCVALRRLVRGARHGELRRVGHGARAFQGPAAVQAQRQRDADAHDGRRVPRDRRVHRREAERDGGAGALPDPRRRRLGDRQAGPAVPRSRGRPRAVRAPSSSSFRTGADRKLVQLPHHINDEAFADALVAAWHEIARRDAVRGRRTNAKTVSHAAHRPPSDPRRLARQDRAPRADHRRRRRHRAVGQVRGGRRHRPHRHLQLGPLPHGRARLARRAARLRQRQRDRLRDGARGAAGGQAHAGARRRERHRSVHDCRRVPASRSSTSASPASRTSRPSA